MSLLSAIMDLLLYNIGELATLSHGDVSKPLSGMEMSDRENLILEGGHSIIISEGNIIKIRPQQELLEEFAPDMEDGKSTQIHLLDVKGKAIIPGLVDCHTHLLWSGDRSNEIRLRQNGLSYQDISKQGGGISKTVEATRNASQKELKSIHKICEYLLLLPLLRPSLPANLVQHQPGRQHDSRVNRASEARRNHGWARTKAADPPRKPEEAAPRHDLLGDWPPHPLVNVLAPATGEPQDGVSRESDRQSSSHYHTDPRIPAAGGIEVQEGRDVVWRSHPCEEERGGGEPRRYRSAPLNYLF